MVLLAVVALKSCGFLSKIIYQNSYPHEVTNDLKGKVASLILGTCLSSVDLCYVVSPHAIPRVTKFAPSLKTRVVPLLVQSDMFFERMVNVADLNPVRFIYIGTLAAERHMDFVLHCFYTVLKMGWHFELMIIGGEDADISALRALGYVLTLEDAGVLKFYGKVPRDEVAAYLNRAHVGISIIPPIDKFIELSPTKLGEYLGSGLAVLANDGIPFQLDTVTNSGAGKVVQYEEDSIVQAICDYLKNPGDVVQMGRNGYSYAMDNLSYDSVIDEIVLDFTL